jgi:putative transposase
VRQLSRTERLGLLVRPGREVAVQRQCELLDLPRSSVYYQPVPASEEDLHLMALLDRQYLLTPFYGSRRMAVWLQSQGYRVNRKRTQRLMAQMGIEAVYPKPSTSKPAAGAERYPYLLRGLSIDRVGQVWASDITYIPMRRGFLYLVAFIDWHSRYVLSWRLSNTLDADFCIEALQSALAGGTPTIFNSDQGCQYTSTAFTQVLKEQGIAISRDGRGRCLDNVFVERLWRSLKYEEVYLRAYEDGQEAHERIGAYLQFFNEERPHQSLRYQTPGAVYRAGSLAQCLEKKDN